MKKQIFSILAMAVLALGLTSCSNDDPADALIVDETATATIIGYVSYIPDLSTGKAAYPASSDVKIIATVPYSDLTGNYSANGNLEIAASYDSTTGLYKVNVPAIASISARVSIKFSAFNGSQVDAASVRVTGLWSPTTIADVTVAKGQTFKAANVTYTFTPAPVQ